MAMAEMIRINMITTLTSIMEKPRARLAER
jgi:hypothetical protein